MTMTDKPNERPGAVPGEIAGTLRRMIRRTRAVIVLRGVCAVAATLIASLLAVMAVDFGITIFSAWVRWLLTLTVAGAAAASVAWFLVRPLARSFTLAGIARVIESRHPELQERISSAVELLLSRDGPELRGSDALIAALVGEATQDARAVRPNREVSRRPARPYLLAAGLGLAVLGALLAAWPKRTSLLLARAVAPGANLPNVSRAQLTILPHGDQVVMAGERLAVEVIVANKAVGSAEIRRQEPGGREHAAAMQRIGDSPDGRRRFLFTCPPARKNFRFRIHAGDALSRYRHVRVVPRPAVRRVDLTYDYPDYTGREPKTVIDAPGDIRALAGTTVTVAAVTNKPVAEAELLINDQPSGRPPLRFETDGRDTTCVFVVELRPGLSGAWALKLTDSYGFVSLPVQHLLEAIPDSPPTIEVLHPSDRVVRLKPTDELPVSYAVADDVGLTEGELLVSVDGRELPSVRLQTRRGATQPALVQPEVTKLDLAAMDLTGARRLTFQLRASDNLPAELGGPQTSVSDVYTVELNVKAPSYVAQLQLSEELLIRQMLEDILDELKQAKQRSVPLVHALRDSKQLSAASVRRIDALRRQLGSADAELQELIQLVSGATYDVMTEKLTDVADNHLAKARNAVGLIRLTDQDDQRKGLAEETDFQIDRSIAKLSELMIQFDAWNRAVHTARQLDEMTVRQQELASLVGRMRLDAQAAADSKELAEWRSRQEELAQELRDMASQMPNVMRSHLLKNQEKSRDLAEEALELAKRQEKVRGQTQKARRLAQNDAQAKALAEQRASLSKQADEARRAELDKKAARLKRLREQQAEALGKEQTEQLLDEQKQLAKEAAELADEIARDAPQGDRLQTTAARSVRQVEQTMAKGDIAAAARRGDEAAGQLDRLARRLGAPQSDGPPPSQAPPDAAQVRAAAPADNADDRRQAPKLGRRARELAQRQKDLSDQMRALASKNPLWPIAGWQMRLAGRVADLAEAADLIREHAADIIPDPEAQQQAALAAEQTAQATQQASRAAKAVQQASKARADAARIMHEAAQAQQAAARTLRKAAETLAKLGQALTEAASEYPATPAEPIDPEQMADALDAADQAAETISPTDAELAGQYLEALAKAAGRRAQEMGLMLFPVTAESAAGDLAGMAFGRGSASTMVDERAVRLEDLDIPVAEWARLPGELRSEILQAARQSGPREYRRLIKRYFRQVAKRGGSKHPGEGP